NAKAAAHPAENDTVDIRTGRGGLGRYHSSRLDIDDIDFVDVSAAVKKAVGGFSGINRFVREAGDAEDFIVAPTGIEGCLHDDIGRVIEGDIRDVGVGGDGVVDGNSNVRRRTKSQVFVVLYVGRGRDGADCRVVVAAVLPGAAEHRVGSVAG